MKDVYLLLGSNEGNREENIKKATEQIAKRCGVIIKHSRLYETEAWGYKEQTAFLNQALHISTGQPAPGLLKLLKTIETETGRTQTSKWGPRIIDIDILYYGDEIIDLPELKIPHPFIQDRKFTMVPLNEIAPELLHPILKKSNAQLLASCTDDSQVRPC